MRKLASALLAVSLLACGGEKPVTSTTTATTTAAQTANAGPRDGGRLVRRMEADVNTLNPLLQSTEDERQVLQYLFDPLIDFDQNLEPIPGTVAKWEILDGGKTYVLHLDPRATFSDGKPVTAEDVIFTLQTIVGSDAVQFAAWFDALDKDRTQAVDDKTVRVAFKEARAPQLVYFNIPVVPKHVYSKGKFDQVRAVVGNGPYVLDRRVTGKNIFLKRNEKYWREKPHFDQVVFRVVEDDTVAWNALKRGDIHVTRLNNDAWFRVKDEPAVTDRIAFYESYELMYNCIPWNLKDPLFQDVRVRRALAMAYDTDTIIQKLYHGNARPVSGPFLPDSWAINPNVHHVDYNPQGAAALLGSAGWIDSDKDGVLDRDGKKFAFTFLVPQGSAVSSAQAQIYQESLKKLGVQMTISTVDGAAFFDRMLKGDFQAAFMAWTIDPDPDPFSLFHSSQVPPAGLNIVHYVNAEGDRLLERGRAEFDRSRRADIYRQFHELIAADQPYLFMMQVGLKWGVDKRIQNVKAAKGVGLFLWRPGPFGWWMRES
ncbi:MAG TPA: ABC transporter substrate-binding protein [Thermoanaerobaculia bacterium]|nr:ABC transporter substrate-binding protein [Thermoanaerobaculia bacterium]